jgi:endonuclease-3
MSWKGRLARNSERPWQTPEETRSSSRTLKGRLARVCRLLEKHFGIPRQRRREDLLDVLIGTLLSQNTNDRNSDLAFEKLKKGFPRWEDVLASDLKPVARAIRSGGLAQQKAKRIREILRWLKKKHGSLSLDFVKKMDSKTIIGTLSQLKGVGPKTLHCLLLFGLGRDEFPVDTHILRIGKRLGFIPDRMNADQAHSWMAPLVPDRKSLSLHINLIRFGRSVCKAITPQCKRCFLRGDCLHPG